MFFRKNKTWEEEKEYRYSIETKFLYDGDNLVNGRCLKNLVAKEIYIGYKMSEEKKKRIIAYCKANNCKLFMVSPSFTDAKKLLLIKKMEI